MSLHDFLSAFIPLFVTIDAIGLVPVFIGVTAGFSEQQRRRISFQAVATALIIAIVFMFLGDAILRFLGITTGDFKIAGGVVLLVLAVIDLLIIGKPAVHEEEVVGTVPLGTPLIAGPATLTTILVLAGRFDFPVTAAALGTNFALLLVVLLVSSKITRLVGLNTMRALSKLMMVLLAAIAVNFIRSGVVEAIAAAR